MMSNKTSAGEIAGVVIVIVVFLVLGIFVCGCGPLPEPAEIGIARMRERKEQREARRAERQRRREMELPLHRSPSQTRNRTITFVDDNVHDGHPNNPTVQPPLPSPPPPTAARNRPPTPQVDSPPGIFGSDGTSVHSRDSSSSVENRSNAGDVRAQADDEQPDKKSSSTLISDKDGVPSTVSVPPPVYMDAVKKE